MKTTTLVILTFLGLHQITFGQDNTFTGNQAGAWNTTGNNNTFTGSYAGTRNTSGRGNTFTGKSAGNNNTTGLFNAFTGYVAGFRNTTGMFNAFTGNSAGRNNITGSQNTFTGSSAGYANNTGSQNTFTGGLAGYANTSGRNNTFVGFYAGGKNKTGSRNVFVGYQAGLDETGSDKLYIANTGGMPLIYGNFSNKRVGIGTTAPSEKLQVEGRMRLGGTNAGIWYETGDTDWFVGKGDSNNHIRFNYGDDKMTLTNDGKLGIGITAPQASLHVNGNIKASQVILNIGSFPDYVFASQYKLMPLEQVEAYINKHQHLPKVPAAAQVIQEGMDVGQVNVLLMEKVEELTLHTIAQHKQIKKQQTQLAKQQQQIEWLLKELKNIKSTNK